MQVLRLSRWALASPKKSLGTGLLAMSALWRSNRAPAFPKKHLRVESSIECDFFWLGSGETNVQVVSIHLYPDHP